MNARERQEAWELEHLQPEAAKAANSRGRRELEEPDPVRTCFQRDRDRIIHCKAFRRLKHKTQVFIDPEEDHFRTRLTHTLEVTQIARTISRALRLNEDLTEAVALAHDLGHPPFGHAGEQALNEAVQEYSSRSCFRHDLQSLRVVQHLERDGRGLNLTWEVLDGIAHHSKGRSDLDDTHVDASTLEGQVVRLADRIAYVNHDIEDAVRAGLFQEDELPTEAISALGNTRSARIATMVIDVIDSSEGRSRIRMSVPVRRFTDRLKDFLFERVYFKSSGESEFTRAQTVVKMLFRYYMEHPAEMTGAVTPPAMSEDHLAQYVCDFVAGMTDRYAVTRFKRHFIPQALSLE